MGATARAACPGSVEQVVAYSVAADRYAVRVDAPTPPARRFVLKRLSTDEPLDDVACAGDDQQCDLTDVLGMRACGFTRVYTSKATLDLSLQKQGDGRDTWSLVLARGDGVIPLLTFRAQGTLELGAARAVGPKVLLVLRERRVDECPEVRARVIEIDAAVLRSSQARVIDPGRVDVDLTVDADFDAPEPRVAPTFPPMPARRIIEAAKAAVASGMPALAECWIRHAATVASVDDRETMRHALAGNPHLSTLLARAPKTTRPKARAPRRRTPDVTIIITAPPHPVPKP